MTYREARDTLETRLAVLLDQREELDASIARVRAAVARERRLARLARGLEPPSWSRRAMVCVGLSLASLVLVAGGVCLLMPRHGCGRGEDGASSLVVAAEMYLADRGKACPTAKVLVAEGFINPWVRTTDSSGRPLRIECRGPHGYAVFVGPVGPDGMLVEVW